LSEILQKQADFDVFENERKSDTKELIFNSAELSKGLADKNLTASYK